MGQLPTLEHRLTVKALHAAYRRKWTVQGVAKHHHVTERSVREACKRYKVRLRDEDGGGMELQERLAVVLPTHTDAEAAEAVGCSLAWANAVRRKLSIPRPPPKKNPLEGRDEYRAIEENESYNEAARDMGVCVETLRNRARSYAEHHNFPQPQLLPSKSQRAYDLAKANTEQMGSPKWKVVCREVFGHDNQKVAQISARRWRDRALAAGSAADDYPWPLRG